MQNYEEAANQNEPVDEYLQNEAGDAHENDRSLENQDPEHQDNENEGEDENGHHEMMFEG
jgi:hypothetical protein